MTQAGDKFPHWLGVSRETEDKLDALCALVVKWNPAINLVSKTTLPEIWSRHVLDSAQLFAFVPSYACNWLDLGSGAGFPGLVLAILAEDLKPNFNITLVESDQRKAVFLSEAVRTLAATASVKCQRIEDLLPQNANIVSARALAPLEVLCGFAKTHLSANGIAIFPKGVNYESEIAKARASWRFSIQTTPSHSDPTAAIISLKDIVNA